MESSTSLRENQTHICKTESNSVVRDNSHFYSHNIKKTLVLHFSYRLGGVKIGYSGTALRERPNTPINVLGSTEAGVPLATDFAPYILMPRMLDNAQRVSSKIVLLHFN